MAAITYLTADPMPPAGAFDLPRKPRMVKAFRLDGNGQVEKIDYENAISFTAQRFEAPDIQSLAEFVTALSKRKDSVLLRGEPKFGYGGAGRRRTLENFPPVPGGVPWVMLDVDNVPIPEEMDPLSREAIEWVVAQLPEPFYEVSYFYQYSASAGILKADGTPLKKGISIHLFFWLGGHLLPDKELAAYFELHCLRTGFYWRRVKKDVPSITYGIDLAVIRNSVQPHYIAPPIIGEGLQCRLAPEHRQDLVVKGRDTVMLPKPEDNLRAKAKHLRRQVDQEWKRENGWVSQSQVTRTSTGAHRAQRYLSAAEAHTGRVFVGATPYGNTSIILELENEKSKGSWFVTKSAPTIAQRFGDSAAVPLREFSEGAYQYVRKELHWFDEVEQHSLALTAEGFVPALEGFVPDRAPPTLILAPTGSGKTRAIIDYVKRKPERLHLYAAPTIPLCRQMVVDLQQAGVPVVFYQDVTFLHVLTGGVVVTTNKSLPRFLAMCHHQSWTHLYTLLVDEVHMGLDEFQRNIHAAKSFEEALTNCWSCLFFTGTMTDVQIAMLGQIVHKACSQAQGELVICRFVPVKTNPLFVLDVGDFDADVLVLFEHLGELKSNGQPLPRTVIAVDGSKLDFYRRLLEKNGLSDCSHVISRKESTEEEVIAAAGNVEHPILVCSPIFGVGLNFASQPQKYWLAYRYLEVDENHIVQSLNRANRTPGQPPAEVRLYVHEPSDVTELPDRAKLRVEVAELLGQETSIETVMDGHYMLDRVTYNELRKGEQKTTAALTKLLDRDGFQNYKVVELPEFPVVDRDELTKMAKKLHKDVRENYRAQVQKEARRLTEDSWSFTVALMDQVFAARRDLRYGGTETTQLDLDNRTQGGLMKLCGLSSVSHAGEVHVVRLRRLMALQLPFVSGNYQPERNDLQYRHVAAGKVRAMGSLIEKLRALKSGSLDGRQFGSWMATRAGQNAVRALADNEADYIALSRTLKQMRKSTESKRSRAGKEARKKIDKDLFARAREFLATLGVVFEKEDPTNMTSPFDPTKPVVPDWDFDAMEVALERLAQSLDAMRYLPDTSDAARYAETPGVIAELCESCVHQDPQGECRMLHPTANHLDLFGPRATECADHKPMSKALRARDDALNAQVPGEQDILPNRYTPYAALHERLWGGTARSLQRSPQG